MLLPVHNKGTLPEKKKKSFFLYCNPESYRQVDKIPPVAVMITSPRQVTCCKLINPQHHSDAGASPDLLAFRPLQSAPATHSLFKCVRAYVTYVYPCGGWKTAWSVILIRAIHCLWGRVSHWSRNSSFRLGWLAQGSSCLCNHGAGFTCSLMSSSLACLPVFWGLNLGPPACKQVCYFLNHPCLPVL